MSDFNVPHNSPLPLYLQLLDELPYKIKNGLPKPHDRLPGEWELIQSLNISRATTQHAGQAARKWLAA